MDAFSRLAHDLGDLIRAEFALFRREAVGQMRPLALAAAMALVAAVMAIAFLGAFTAFAIAALSLAMPLWGAALLVTVLYGIAAGVFVAMAWARAKSALPLNFDKTVNSVKEDVAWTKSALSSRP